MRFYPENYAVMYKYKVPLREKGKAERQNGLRVNVELKDQDLGSAPS